MAICVRKTKNGKTRYFVRYRDRNGVSFPSMTFNRKSDAREYERELIARSRQDECVATTAKAKSMTVDEYIAEWFDRKLCKISVGWGMALKRMYNDYVKDKIGSYTLREVKPPHVGRVLNAMSRKKLSNQTILHVYQLLGGAFKDAVEYYGYLEKSPVLKVDRPKVHQQERDYLSPEDSWKLLDHCKNHYLGPAIWLGILSGLRVSEIQALQWKSVDFQKGQILICSAFNRSIREIQPYPKQKDWALVPMPAPLMEYFDEHRHVRPPNQFVAPAKEGGMLDHNKFYMGLKRLAKEAGVPHVSPHGLRHSCTEIWIHNGANLEDIRRLLNHKTTETTRRYVHRTDDRLLDLARVICRR